MPKCAICPETAATTIDNISLCRECNLTMQTGSRDTVMQTLGLLGRLIKAEAKLQLIAESADEIQACILEQPTWVTGDSYAAQAEMRRRCAGIAVQVFQEIMLKDDPGQSVIETWYEIEVDHHDGATPNRSTRLAKAEADRLSVLVAENLHPNSTLRTLRITKTETTVS